jgi:hypothetical protein
MSLFKRKPRERTADIVLPSAEGASGIPADMRHLYASGYRQACEDIKDFDENVRERDVLPGDAVVTPIKLKLAPCPGCGSFGWKIPGRPTALLGHRLDAAKTLAVCSDCGHEGTVEDMVEMEA